MKKAFTFVETLVATAVSGMVLLAVCSTFVVGQRLIREAMAQTELSVAARELREKEVVALLLASPEMDMPILAERLGVGIGMAYRVVAGMQKKGMVERDRRRGIWKIGKEAEQEDSNSRK